MLSALSRNLVPEGPAVIGVAEVENHRVLTDLVSQPAMANYKFVHYEGSDRRGIDCALLYDPQQFAVTWKDGVQVEEKDTRTYNKVRLANILVKKLKAKQPLSKPELSESLKKNLHDLK